MSDYFGKTPEVVGKRAGLMDKCAECGQDYYGTHIANCSQEEDIEMCGICDRFYHRYGKTISSQCVCEREGKQ
jgi:hypothetical protein